MKILYFSRDYTPHDKRFLEALSITDHEIFFLRLENEGEKRWGFPPQRIHQIPWLSGTQCNNTVESWIAKLPSFCRIIDEIKPDIIHSGPIYSCGFITALSGFHPFLAMSWGSDLLLDIERSDTLKWMSTYTLRHADIFFCDSTCVEQRAKELVALSQTKILKFPWGVDLSTFSLPNEPSRLRQTLKWDETFNLICMRSWEPIYGIEMLLAAFNNALSYNANLRLFLIGHGSLSEKIVQYIHDKGLTDYVFCPGILPNESIKNYLHASDLYVSCSQVDGTSVSMLEAMATGLPVLVSDIPGNKEWVIEDENGWLFPCDNAHLLSEKLILTSKTEKPFLVRIGERNRKVIKERANWKENFNSLLSIYKSNVEDQPIVDAQHT